MKTTIEIDSDCADGIVVASLEDMMTILRNDVAMLRRKKKLPDWQKEDLDRNLEVIRAMEIVHDFYGGNVKE